MIRISGHPIDPAEIMYQFPAGGIELQMLGIMSSSREIYDYAAPYQLDFELSLRKSIVRGAVDLNRSAFSFRTFRDSICNPYYWERTDEGGFHIRNGVSPSEAVNDIFLNSRAYGTECSTAIIVIYCKALVDIFPAELFDKLFSDIYLMNWQSLDRDLGVTQLRDPADYLPGDCRYVRNPDVNPLTPEWQGENIIDFGNDMYYGHGIGIRPIQNIIMILNEQRRPGAEVSAYLIDSVNRPSFRYLADRYHDWQSSIASI